MKLGVDFSLDFVPDIPWLRVLSFTLDGLSPLDPAAGGSAGIGKALAFQPDMAGGGVMRITIHFSLPFDTEAKREAADRISLNAFFPGTLDPTALRFAAWLSSDRIRLEWEGLKPGLGDERHFYLLTVPGGRGGISAGAEAGGLCLKEDQRLYLEAVP
jgi:hypothetical protein